MQKANLANLQCPIAQSLERVGEWWNILILREAFYGSSRFDEFQKELGIAPNMLTKRLNDLVLKGILDRIQYCEKPPRYEYKLTKVGEDFRPVLLAFLNWGNKHFAADGIAVKLIDRETGKTSRPILIDSVTGKPISAKSHAIVSGPAANEELRKKLKRD
jgi:DNA-binding HxlR family transcriptional regulator